MNKIINEVLESNYYYNTSNIIMKFIDTDDYFSLNNECINKDERISSVKIIKIMGTVVVDFKFKNRKCDIMTLNKLIIITLYPI
jgi:hypothetical protein